MYLGLRIINKQGIIWVLYAISMKNAKEIDQNPCLLAQASVSPLVDMNKSSKCFY
jgi:hypothetical protein